MIKTLCEKLATFAAVTLALLIICAAFVLVLGAYAFDLVNGWARKRK